MEILLLKDKLRLILQVIAVVLLVVVLGNAATSTKLYTPKKIILSGAVSGNAEFDGSKDVSIVTIQNNIIKLSGTVTVPASSNKVATIGYPEGYNINNCVPVACGLKVIDNKGYNYEGTYTDSSDILNNSYKRRLNLTSNNITLTLFNPNSDQAVNVSYIIVLMKIS